MLSSLRDVKNTKIIAGGDEVGRASDMIFDAKEWTLRYVVIDLGGWLKNKKAVIPLSLFKKEIDWSKTSITLDTSKEKLEAMPSPDSVDLITEEHEDEVHRYFGVPPYWAVGVTASMVPGFTPEDKQADIADESEEASKFRRKGKGEKLISGAGLIGFKINTVDGEIGPLKDLVFDSENRKIHYLVIYARNITPEREVILTTLFVKSIDRKDSSIFVDCESERIVKSPEYYSSQRLDRDNESKIHEHYGIRKYWE